MAKNMSAALYVCVSFVGFVLLPVSSSVRVFVWLTASVITDRIEMKSPPSA